MEVVTGERSREIRDKGNVQVLQTICASTHTRTIQLETPAMTRERYKISISQVRTLVLLPPLPP